MGLFISPAQTLILSAPSSAELFAWLQSGVPGRRYFHFCPLPLSPLFVLHMRQQPKNPNQTNKSKQKTPQTKPNPSKKNHRECNDFDLFSVLALRHPRFSTSSGQLRMVLLMPAWLTITDMAELSFSTFLGHHSHRKHSRLSLHQVRGYHFMKCIFNSYFLKRKRRII